MAPGAKHKSFNPRREITNFLNKYCTTAYVKSLIIEPAKLPIVSCAIIICELILNIFIVQRVRYTEIDWIAYMQECEGFLNGTTNYALLKGDTGPLVYPAGFVYVYTIFYYATAKGTNIRLAQYIFVVIYLMQMYLVLRLYSKSRKVPPYVLVISAFTSYRIHSIYVLRLFNDPIAILLLYAALNAYIDGKWSLGSVLLSLGVSIKMNVLLFAPAILLLFIVNLGYVKTAIQLLICGIIQLVLGAPFLLTHPIEYVRSAFDLGRIFEHKWTVNYRFLPRDTFENQYFHIGLLIVHVGLLAIFFMPSYRYVQSYCRLRNLQAQLQPQIDAKNANVKKKKSSEPILSDNQQKFLDSFERALQKSSIKSTSSSPTSIDGKYEISFDTTVQLALLPVFLANFIGVMCARSLHYQFYVWYFHSLPYLVWFTNYNVSGKLLLLGLAEFAWNTYPSTIVSSVLLHIFHLALLYGIARVMFHRVDVPNQQEIVVPKAKKVK